jgi:hypothetical protein
MVFHFSFTKGLGMPSTELPEAHLQNIRRQLDEAKRSFDALEMQPNESLLDFEYRVKDHSDKLLSLKVAEKVQLRLIEQEAREAEEQLKKKDSLTYEGKSPFRIHGWLPINVLFLGGNEIQLVSRFFARNKSRSDNGKGFHPGLALLGISERLSPAMLNLLAKSAAALGSHRDAQGALADQGINVSITRISTAVRAVALAARTLRTNDETLKTLETAGRKIVVSIDGGRLRIRNNKKGPKTQKNRTRYKTDWREPKLLCIYVLDENGNVDRSIPPILDGTMAHVDEIFKMLCVYLSMLSIDPTTEVLYISDGANCLWDRVHLVEKVVRDKGGRFHCLLDYYHMKGYLYTMAGAMKDWTKKKRTQWIRRLTKFLFAGDDASFEKELKLLQRGSRKGSVLRTAGNYLLKHVRSGHMNYVELRGRKFPIGSGVIESTIRRVVNLRLKGASVYWKESTANDMLLLRCLYKANRWNNIEKQGKIFLKTAA